VGFATRQGFLRTQDTTGGAASIVHVGHVFGTLGQGADAMPGVATPFYWGTAAGTDTPGMMVTIMPNTEAMTALVTDKFVKFTGKKTTFVALSSFAAPSQPAAPVAPVNKLGAMALKATLAAAAVAFTLY